MSRRARSSGFEAGGGRDSLEVLAEEFFQELREGRGVSVEEFAARYPEQESEIRRLFPALMRLERAGEATLGDATPSTGLERLGEYRILRVIGKGGMGVVYEAEHETLGRRVALKVLPPHAAADPRFLERFRREALAAASLKHGNIVPVYGTGADRGVHFIAMRLVEGGALDLVLNEVRTGLPGARPGSTGSTPGSTAGRRPSTASELTACTYAGERYFDCVARTGLLLAEALAHAHAHGVLHRDVKPSNVLLDRSGEPWLSDFGLAQIEDVGDLTLSGEVVGTLRYMAPERLSGDGDARVDVYGLGMILYELITLRPPFGETDAAKLVQLVAKEAPPRPARVEQRVPKDLESITLKATEKLPELRYSSAAEMAGDLRAFLERRPITARPPSVAHLLGLAVGRNKPLAATVCLALGMLLVASLLYVGGLKESRRVAHEALVSMRAQALVSASAEAQEIDGTLSLLLAREALRTQPTSDAFSRLQHALVESRERAVFRRRNGFVDLTLSPDGETLLASTQHHVYLLGSSGEERGRLDIPGWVSAANFSPDGQQIVAATRKGALRVWDLAGTELLRMEDLGKVGTAVFSPDGEALLTASLDGTARLLTLEGQTLDTLSHPSGVLSAAFSADGRRVVTGCVDGVGRLWTIKPVTLEARLEKELVGHTGQVSRATFSARGDRILTHSCVSLWRDPAYGDETARLWDSSGRPVATLGARTRRLQWAGFDPAGERVFGLFTDGKVRVWDTDGEQLFEGHSPTRSPAWFPGFSGDGRRLAFGCMDGSAWLFDERARLVASLAGHGTQVYASRVTSDGRSIVTASADGTVRFWDAAVLPAFHGHGAAVYRAQYSPDGELVVSASEDWTARLWGAGGKPLAQFRGHEAYVRTAVFSPDGLHVLTSSRDRTARLWDLDGVQKVEYSHASDTGAAAFSADGLEVATVCRDGTVTIWAREGERLEAFHLNGWPTSVAFSNDGERLLVGLNWQAALCSRKGDTLLRFVGHTANVNSVQYSPDGQYVLTASSDGTARLWDGVTEDCLVVFEGHQGGLHQASFSSDGARIITAAEDDTIRTWSLSGQTLSVQRGQNGLHSAVFSPDGTRILSSSWTGRVQVWPTDREEVLELVERRAHRDFSRDEFVRYAGPLGLPVDAALELTDGLMEELLMPERVMARIQADTLLDPDLRATALRVAASLPEPTASELNDAAWSVVERPGRAVEEVEHALGWAEQAHRESPQNSYFLGTLGVAQLRAGLYDLAVESLRQADELHAGAEDPLNRAFQLLPLALALEGAGRHLEARDALAEGRRLMTEAEEPEARRQLESFLHEARSAVGDE